MTVLLFCQSESSVLPQLPRATDNNYRIQLGVSGNGDGTQVNGVLAESITFNKSLSANDKALVETNIRNYYGI